jgi:sec-independent protein translocase protein TatC
VKRRDPDRTLSYAEHLSELRRRLLVSALAVVAASVAAYSFRDALVDLVRRPVADVPFVFLDPPELFLANIKIAVLAGLVIAAPFIFFQIWMFVRPGLKTGERITVGLAILFGTLFFAAGALFGYLVVLPMTLRFFLQYETGAIRASLSFGRYVGFLTSLLLAFGIAFELPMLVLVLARLGIVDARRLARWRKYALLAILIVAAILTPPDVVSQLLLAGPMLVLYEISIFVARLARRPADPRE